MNVKKVPLTNALNLSLFMVNVSQVLLHDFRRTNPDSGILDLKAYFRAAKYFEETIKMGTIEDVLKDCGWRKSSRPQKRWIPPAIIGQSEQEVTVSV